MIKTITVIVSDMENQLNPCNWLRMNQGVSYIIGGVGGELRFDGFVDGSCGYRQACYCFDLDEDLIKNLHAALDAVRQKYCFKPQFTFVVGEKPE